MTFENSHSATSSPGSASGPTPSDKQGGPTINRSGPAPALVNLSAFQAEVLGLLTSGTYGRPGSISSKSKDLQSSLANRLQARTASLGSTLYKLTWKARTTPAGRSIYALRASVRRISDSDNGLLRKGWNTPRATDGSNGGPNQKGEALPADAALAGWVTPASRDWKDSGTDIAPRPDNGKQRFDQLPRQANLAGWPTPRANDGTGGKIPPGRQGGLALKTAVTLVNGPARLTATGSLLTGSTAGMGKWRPVEPGTFPLVNGAPARVGRLRGYGNAINAEVAAHFIKAYLEITMTR